MVQILQRRAENRDYPLAAPEKRMHLCPRMQSGGPGHYGLELQESGEYEVVLDTKIRLKSSRRFRKRLQDRLSGL